MLTIAAVLLVITLLTVYLLLHFLFSKRCRGSGLPTTCRVVCSSVFSSGGNKVVAVSSRKKVVNDGPLSSLRSTFGCSCRSNIFITKKRHRGARLVMKGGDRSGLIRLLSSSGCSKIVSVRPRGKKVTTMVGNGSSPRRSSCLGLLIIRSSRNGILRGHMLGVCARSRISASRSVFVINRRLALDSGQCRNGVVECGFSAGGVSRGIASSGLLCGRAIL